MKKTTLAVILGAMMAWATAGVCEDQPGAAAAPEKQAAVAQAVYVCPDCHTMAMAAGKCTKCGMDMKPMHMLGMKEGKCGCGKDVTTMAVPAGMYVCACADGKCCSAISDKPGKCACGKDMKKVEAPAKTE